MPRTGWIAEEKEVSSGGPGINPSKRTGQVPVKELGKVPPARRIRTGITDPGYSMRNDRDNCPQK